VGPEVKRTTEVRHRGHHKLIGRGAKNRDEKKYGAENSTTSESHTTPKDSAHPTGRKPARKRGPRRKPKLSEKMQRTGGEEKIDVIPIEIPVKTP